MTNKALEANTLMSVHKIISESWQLLKKHIPLSLSGKWGNQEEWAGLIKECEALAKIGGNEAAQELAKDFSIAIYKYLDNARPQGADKGKTTKTPTQTTPQQRTRRPA